MLTRLLYLGTSMALFALPAGAQVARSRMPAGGEATAPSPRRADFPFAGLWRGPRALPPGTDTMTMVFTVEGSGYKSAEVHPDGVPVPPTKLTTTKSRVLWEQRNSGGGVWVYDLKLVSQDRMEGTVILRDAPPNLQPPPKGTIALARRLPAERR